MPVNSEHPQYQQWADKWQRCRDTFAGEDAIKEAGKKYLPELPGHKNKPDDYAAYKMRTLYLEAAARTLQGLVGAVFRKDPTLEAPTAAQGRAWLEWDVTGRRMPWDRLAQHVLAEVLAVGRCGLYVTHTDDEAEVPRPYVQPIAAEAIVNWRTEYVGGEQRLAWVVLREIADEPDPADAFVDMQVEQYRVLKMGRDTADGGRVCMVEVWREDKDALADEDKWRIVETTVPLRRGQPLDHIPFYFVGASSTDAAVEKPPLLGLVNTNLNHYQQNADYRNVLFFCAAGVTAWVAGFDASTELKLGGSTAWVTDNDNAKAGFLEFTGQGAQPLVDSLDKLEHYMAYQGGRLLAQPKKAVEAAETHRLRAAAEAVTVQSVSQVVGQALGAAYTEMLNWGGVEGTVEVTLNSDLTDGVMDYQMLNAQVQALQTGAISFDTFWFNLERGELVPPGISAEDERRRIEIQAGAGDLPEDGDGLIEAAG